MNLVTGAYEDVEVGDRVGIIRFDEKADETIYIGTVQGKQGNRLETSIPGSTKNARYEILGIKGEPYSNPSAEKWFDRFESSDYMLYMKVEKKSSGNISVDGV